MAYLTPVEAPPILAVQDGYITSAATVTARVMQNGKAFVEVVTWEAGQGQRVDWLSPAEFSTWRQSFARPPHES